MKNAKTNIGKCMSCSKPNFLNSLNVCFNCEFPTIIPPLHDFSKYPERPKALFLPPIDPYMFMEE